MVETSRSFLLGWTILLVLPASSTSFIGSQQRHLMLQSNTAFLLTTDLHDKQPVCNGKDLFGIGSRRRESSSSATTTSLAATTNTKIAQELIRDLVVDQQCYSTVAGAEAFGEICAFNIIYEDCFEAQPINGKIAVQEHMLKKVAARKGRGELRMDKISDGNTACGFCWTYTSGNEEGLRGTTFVKLNDQGYIVFVREIAEPLYKPGDLTLELLKTVTADAEPTPPPVYDPQTPTTACSIVDYLFNVVQGSSSDEAMRFFSPSIQYRDFNYEDMLQGKTEVKKFIDDFSFPGITFRAQLIDDGETSCCFVWDVVIMDAPDTVLGISFYEIDPETRLITYVRDCPASAIRPPPIGKLARDFRPGLGVFSPVPLGSRKGGM